MQKFLCIILCLCSFLIMRNEALAGPGLCRVTTNLPSWTTGKDVPCSVDVNGVLRIGNAYTETGDDTSNDVKKVESRFTTLPSGASTAMFSVDTLIKSSAGYIDHLTCYSDATATAGTIDIRDNTAAGAGDILFSLAVLAQNYAPFTIWLNTPFVVGLYVDFTTTADMVCSVVYR